MKVEFQHTADDGVTKQHVTDQLPPQLPALMYTIQYVAEHRLAFFFFPFGAGQGAFYPFIRKLAPLEILICRGGLTLGVTLLVIQFRNACVVLTDQTPSPASHPLSREHKTQQPKTLFYI